MYRGLCPIFLLLLPTLPLTLPSLVHYRDNPPYTNATSLPLYGPTQQPLGTDINSVVSKEGWFEAVAAAVAETDPHTLTRRLQDLDDGTVNVSLFQGGKNHGITVNKRPYGSANGSVAWPSALFDAVQRLNETTDSTKSLTDTTIIGLYTTSISSNCSVPNGSPSKNPYQLSKNLPVVAYIGNSTQKVLTNRFLHLMTPSVNSTGNSDVVVFDTASIPGYGVGTSNISLTEWMNACQTLWMP
jgi:hypothetical protein